MYFFFEIIKGFFFFLTILIGLFFLKGDIIFGANYFEITKKIIMPGYLIFCGLMIGYIIARIWIGNEDEEQQDEIHKKIYIKSFIGGILIGTILSIMYIFI